MNNGLSDKIVIHDFRKGYRFSSSFHRERPSIGINEVAELCHMGSSSMSAVVERLVKGEYIVRTRSDADRRSVKLQITDSIRHVRFR